MKIKLFAVLFMIYHTGAAQWSTSTYAESALYVCPGFNQGILTHCDGSSIICGVLNDYLYVQKLDPFGYKIWQQPVEVFNTPETNASGGVDMISDGAGGVILGWSDHRGAELGQYGYYNNAVYIQYIDKNGNKKWQDGGIQLAPLQGGIKGGAGVIDGQGGIIFYLKESDFLRTGARKIERTWLVSYNSIGQMSWEHSIDSSIIQYSLSTDRLIKFGNRIMIGTQSGSKFINNLTGEYQANPSYIPNGEIIPVNDSIAYVVGYKGYVQDSVGVNHYHFSVTIMNAIWDSVWSVEFAIDDEGDGSTIGGPFNTPFVVDQKGGFFYVWLYKNKDNILTTGAHWINQSGLRWGESGIRIAKKGCYAAFSGESTLGMYFSDGTAQVYDTNGTALWDANNVIINDLNNVYTPVYAGDNNGGCIIVFWTTLGGIYAQHTGRVGKVGVITKVSNEPVVTNEFFLKQNYPNPFNSITSIQFYNNTNNLVVLKVFDLLGREIQTLVNNDLQSGAYNVQWDASNFASGIYFYSLIFQNRTITKKMILLR